MPKMKTKSAAKKRIRVTGSGKLMQAGDGMRHNLEHKSSRKRRARSRDTVIARGPSKRMGALMGR